MRDHFIEEICEWYFKALNTKMIDDTAPCYHRLSYKIDSFVITQRSEHRNPRVELLRQSALDEGSEDLLSKEGADNDSEMHQLDDLVDALKSKLDGDPQSVLEKEFIRVDDEEAAELLQCLRTQRPSEIVAVVAVTLVGGHCARIDGNSAAAADVWEWSVNAPVKLKPRTIASLCVVDRFGATGTDENGKRQDAQSMLDKSKEVVRESRQQLGIEDCPEGDHTLSEAKKADYRMHRWLLAQLTDAIASLPAATLRQDVDDDGSSMSLGDAWLEQVLPWFSVGHKNAVFHQYHARILLALGRLDDARNSITEALKHAKPHMLQSIEASRQMQLAIDLDDITKRALAQTADEIEKKSEAVKDDVLGELKAQAAEERKTTQDENRRMEAESKDEIQSALIRVVEVLGLFLAIVGVAFTAVGGIAVEGSFTDKALVWVLGYSTLVSLFWLLRRITGGRSARNTWDYLRNEGKRSESGAESGENATASGKEPAGTGYRPRGWGR